MPWYPHPALPLVRTCVFFFFPTGVLNICTPCKARGEPQTPRQASERQPTRNIQRWRNCTTHSTQGISASNPAAWHKDQSLHLQMLPSHPGLRAAWHLARSSFVELQFSGPQPRRRQKRIPSERCPPTCFSDHLVTRASQTNYTFGTLKTLGN